MPNFDDSLAIYRISFNTPDVRLFNISGSIIPPNGSANSSNRSFVNLEQIPSRELDFDQDIFCLSEFEYRSEEFRIFVNVIQLYVVSEEGEFCARSNGTGRDCSVFYTSKISSSTVAPATLPGRFNDECSRPRHPQLQSRTSVRPEHRRQPSHKQDRAPSKWRTTHRVLPRAHQHRARSVPYSVSSWLHLPDSGHISNLCCPVYVRLPSLVSEFQLQA